MRSCLKIPAISLVPVIPDPVVAGSPNARKFNYNLIA